jgi:tight adherence protein B
VTPALATALAAVAGGLAGASVALAAPALARLGHARVSPLLRSGAREVERLLEPLRRAGMAGVVPSDRERVRLQAGAAFSGLVIGALLLGPLAGLVLALVAAIAASRALFWRRARFARRLDRGVASAAVAIADALAGGLSTRSALIEAPVALRGAIGVELQVVARELEMGAETDAALERLRKRTRSRRIELVVAAIRLQRRSGGSLATLLREIAASIEERERLHDEVRAATAQARFTSLVVLLMPVGALALGELALPGMVARMLGSPVGATLAAGAALLQVAGVLLVRRIARIQ